MDNNVLKTINSSITHWYIPLIVGLIFVGTGAYTFTAPLESFLALSILFSVSFLLSGAIEIAFSLSNRNEMKNWGWNLAFGVFTFVIGVILISHPALSVATLPIYVGFLLLFRSIMGISFAIELKNNGIKGWGTMMALGGLGVIFSFMLFLNPVFAGMTIVFWVGLTFISAGVFSILLAFKLKKLNTLSA